MQAIAIPEPAEHDEAAAALHKRLGDEAFVRKDYNAAVSAYSKSLQHSTSSHIPWANRSAAHLQLQQSEQAMKDAQISRTICPTFAKVCSLCFPVQYLSIHPLCLLIFQCLDTRKHLQQNGKCCCCRHGSEKVLQLRK